MLQPKGRRRLVLTDGRAFKTIKKTKNETDIPKNSPTFALIVLVICDHERA